MTSLDAFRIILSGQLQGTVFENVALFAGGCVRNHLLRRDISDIDLCVLLPDGEIKLAEYLFQNGLGSKPVIYKHTGTVRSVFQGVTLEISIAHGACQTGETPGNSYEPASLTEDALRRDFTINALYMEIITGVVLDPCGSGLNDLQQGIIRTVTDQEQVFKADPIRILRGIRFAAEFGFVIDNKVWAAMQDMKGCLMLAAPERIKKEFYLMLKSSDPALAFELLIKSGSLCLVAPEFSFWICGQGTFSKACMNTFNALKTTDSDSISRWLCILKEYLLHRIDESNLIDGKGSITELRQDLCDLMKRYYLGKHDINRLLSVLMAYAKLKLWIARENPLELKEMRRIIYEIGEDFTLLKEFLLTDAQITRGENLSLRNHTRLLENLRIKESNMVFPLNGRKIMEALGIRPSPTVGLLLTRAKEYWFADPTLNDEKIIWLLRKDFASSIVSL